MIKIINNRFSQTVVFTSDTASPFFLWFSFCLDYSNHSRSIAEPVQIHKPQM